MEVDKSNLNSKVVRARKASLLPIFASQPGDENLFPGFYCVYRQGGGTSSEGNSFFCAKLGVNISGRFCDKGCPYLEL